MLLTKRKLLVLIIAALLVFTSGCSLLFPEKEGISIIASYTPTPIPSKAPVATALPQKAPAVERDIPAACYNAMIGDKVPADCRQVIFVTVSKDDKYMVCLDKRDDGRWEVIHGAFPVTIGRKGLGKEKEGDSKSPEGVFGLGLAYGYGGAPEGCTWPWQEVDHDDFWVEDGDSAYYNQFVSLDAVQKDWQTASKLMVSKYQRAIEVLYNQDNEPGKGSAIFLHIWAGETKSTGGGTASSKETLDIILAWLKKEANPRLVQLEIDDALPRGYGYLVDYAPEVLWDIKFSGEDNFIGRRVKGYKSNAPIVSEAAGRALKKANDMLKYDNLKLMLLDGYRPAIAQEDIMEWTYNDDKSTKDRYYPDRTKAEIRKEYLSYDEEHCEGAAVDVILCDRRGEPVDMGGLYFYFGRNSDIEGVDLSNEQYNYRELLRDAMVQADFKPQDSMWWHFDLVHKPFPGEDSDFTVK